MFFVLIVCFFSIPEEEEDEQSLSCNEDGELLPRPHSGPFDLEADDPLHNFEWGMEHAQRQLINVGCKPCLGWMEDWNFDKYEFERKTLAIEDGHLCEFGYGNQCSNHEADRLCEPIEMNNDSNSPAAQTSCPLVLDKITMDNDDTGDCSFLVIERLADGIRHTIANSNADAEYTKVTEGPFKNATMSPDPLKTKTAGMISNTSDIFNKSYWLNKCKGPNNGVCWDNKIYFTFVDNLRGHIYRHTMKVATGLKTPYNPADYGYRLRHIKEYQVQAIVRKCYVKLEAKLITNLLQWNRSWLKTLGFKFNTPEALHPLAPPSVFRNVNDVNVQEPEEEDQTHNITCVSIDCNGSARFRPVHAAHEVLAQHFRALNGADMPPPAKAAPKRKAAQKK